MKWDTAKLGDITDSCLGKMLDQNKNRGTYQSYLANNNVRWGTFELDDLSQMKFLDTEEERYGLKYGDLVICEGGEPGRCAIWKEQLPNMKIQKALHRVRAHDSLDIRFLYYWFLDAGRKGALDQYFTGATIKHMPGDKLKSIVIDKPPLLVQHKIADSLSSYDDLIENNQKQIKLLEEAAQRLYKEWFVDLRFPGHEKTPIVDGVPEGWEYKRLSDIGRIVTGKTPPTERTEYYGGDIPFVKIPDMYNNVYPISTEIYLSPKGALTQENKFIPKNGIMVSCIATVGLVNIAYKTCQTNQQINSIILHDDKDVYYLYYVMKDIKNILDGIGSNGATMTNVNKAKFSNLLIVYPDREVRDKYFSFCMPLFEKILTLSLSVRAAAEARDRLLPKLMCGEMEV